METSLQDRRLQHLRRTWSYARAHSPYYGRVLPDIAEDRLTLADLQRVPVLTPRQFAERGPELRCSRELPDYVVFTGGTTGLPRMIYHGEADVRGEDAAWERRPGGLRALGLMTGGGHHGHVPFVPGQQGHICIPLRNRKNHAWAWTLLTAEHHHPGYEAKISYAVLPLPALKKLVHYLLEQGHDLTRLGLDTVMTYAWYLSDAWRTFIERTLNVLVIDTFGFTEISALATECLLCGHYHWDERVVWEVVDPWTYASLDKGTGKLLVSSLYPFTRDHMLLRYDPGDLVALGPVCEEVGERGFRPLGRFDQALFLREGGRAHCLLAPVQVQERVDFDHRMARLEETRFAGVTRTGDDGFPRWRASKRETGDRCLLDIELEIKASPFLFPEAGGKLVASVRSALLRANPDLLRLVDAGRVELQVAAVPPGTIPDDDVCVC